MESLVAISILVVVIMSAMSSVQSGISSYIFSKDQIVAFYLAQEGFEQIKNIRDENRLNNRGWLDGITSNSSDPCYFGNACTVSPAESSVPTRCSGVGACAYVRNATTTGFYGYNSSWTQTVFRREIQLTSISADEVAVTVTVNWSKGLVNKQFKARENIYNYQ